MEVQIDGTIGGSDLLNSGIAPAHRGRRSDGVSRSVLMQVPRMSPIDGRPKANASAVARQEPPRSRSLQEVAAWPVIVGDADRSIGVHRRTAKVDFLTISELDTPPIVPGDHLVEVDGIGVHPSDSES